MADPVKGYKISDDALEEDLKKDGLKRDHTRSQRLLDHVARILSVAVYLVPSLLLVGVLLVIGRWIYEGNWAALSTAVERLFLFVGGYLVSQLEKLGVTPRSGD